MKIKHDQSMLDQMSKNPANWRGPFYVNRNDPRLMVPKIFPRMGVTLNFASPYAIITIIALLAIIIGSSVIGF